MGDYSSNSNVIPQSNVGVALSHAQCAKLIEKYLTRPADYALKSFTQVRDTISFLA